MVKGFRAPGETAKTSIRIQKGVKSRIADRLKEQGLSIKARSAWVTKAVDQLMSLPDFEDIVADEFLAGESESLPYTSTTTFLDDIDSLAEKAKIATRINVDRSSVIRSAITQALIWEGSVLFNPKELDKTLEDEAEAQDHE